MSAVMMMAWMISSVWKMKYKNWTAAELRELRRKCLNIIANPRHGEHLRLTAGKTITEIDNELFDRTVQMYQTPLIAVIVFITILVLLSIVLTARAEPGSYKRPTQKPYIAEQLRRC